MCTRDTFRAQSFVLFFDLYIKTIKLKVKIVMIRSAEQRAALANATNAKKGEGTVGERID